MLSIHAKDDEAKDFYSHYGFVESPFDPLTLVIRNPFSSSGWTSVTAWWCEVFDGPADYTSELGGYERMVHKHMHLGISDDQRVRFSSLMSMAADDAGMPRDP